MMKTACSLWVLVFLGFRFEAEACEPFRFEDPDLGRMVSFLVGSVRIPREPEDLVLFRVEGAQPAELRATAGNIALGIEGEDVKIGGAVVGALKGSELVVGTVGYQIELGALKGKKLGVQSMTVARAGMPLVKVSAPAGLCLADGPQGTPAELEEIRRRLVYYLLWRERLVPASLRPGPEKLEQRLVLHLTAAGSKKFRTCQTKSSFSDPPGAAGKIEVKVTADARGGNLNVETLANSTGSAKLEKCLTEALSSLEVGTLFAGVSVNFPFVIKPGK